MAKNSEATIACAVTWLVLLIASVAAAQQASPAPTAPVPSQISTAKKVFISNAEGEEVDPRSFGFPNVDPNRPYNQLYAMLKSGGRFEPVLAPADADLVLEIRFTHIVLPVGIGVGHILDPLLIVDALDPRTHILLWAFHQRVEASGGPHGLQKREANFNQAMTAIVTQLASLAGQAGTVAVAK